MSNCASISTIYSTAIKSLSESSSMDGEKGEKVKVPYGELEKGASRKSFKSTARITSIRKKIKRN